MEKTVDGATAHSHNPFRYRGYYYDSDLNLYYLNSRYYDHTLGRFISPDSEAVITATPTALTDKNLYAYCDNNPIVRMDQSGDMWQFVPAMDPRNYVYGGADGMPFSGGSSGYYYDSSAYRTYQIRTSTASYDAGLGGYHYGGGSSFGGYTGQFATGGRASVTDSMANGSTSKGSTAKRGPANLTEKLALESVKSNPSGKTTKLTMEDPRWPGYAGWVKMQQLVFTSKGCVNIHYVYNTRLHTYDDFKIVD